MTIDDLVRCVGREIAMRRRVYPKWVESGRMKQAAADHEITCMSKIEEIIKGLKTCGTVSIERDATASTLIIDGIDPFELARRK